MQGFVSTFFEGMFFLGRLKNRARTFRAPAVCALGAILAFPGLGDATGPSRDYEQSADTAVEIGDALYQALPLKLGNAVNAHPLVVAPCAEPFIFLAPTNTGKKLACDVSISSGMLDFFNHVAHAKAADRVAPGFYDDYLKRIALTPSGRLTLPEIADARFWTLPVRNRQMSLFNQMVGVLTAINLSHYYLGHYAKYAERLAGTDQSARSINLCLTPAEWDESVKAGAVNSMICALATQGGAVLYDAVSKLPQRPAWVDGLAPPFADLHELSKRLADYETNFYKGQLGAENAR